MSFFRNLRSSITRGRSSSRDTTPVRNSRPGSVISSLNSGSGKRRDSIESRTDSLFNRSETFILDEPDDTTPCHSNCSTLEKKSKKSKVLEKFSTFTKRKKTPSTSDTAAFEHHPSDNATNTYYKWQADGVNSLDYDSQNDPFHFLYEQQSSLKSLQHNGINSSSQGESLKSTTTNSSTPVTFDSSTYRKSKMPADLKKQIKTLKDPDYLNKENDLKHGKKPQTLNEEEPEEEGEDEALKADKYKTITLNSFRKSFREKFLQQQKEAAAYNPAWFVEVDPAEMSKNKRDQRESSKENRRDLLVFENDNYRPGSRSPIRDLSNRKTPRSPTRSPVKRNETFKVDRLSRLEQMDLKKKQEDSTTPSIRIEFKNSITPHIPGRMVPVGVAKPMPSQLNYYHKTETNPLNTSYSIKSSNTSSTRLNNHSPIRSPWVKEQTPSRNLSNSNKAISGKYQTLVQIKNDKPPQASPIIVRNSRLSTRIQLGNNPTTNLERKSQVTSLSPSFSKRYNSTHLINQNSSPKLQPLRQTYFGEGSPTTRTTTPSSHLSTSTSALRTRTMGTPNYGGYKYLMPSSTSKLFSSATTLTPSSGTTTTTSSSSSRTTPSHSVNNIHSSSNNNLSYLKHYQQQQQQPSSQQHQSRILVAQQRRSRSPIKIPWR